VPGSVSTHSGWEKGLQVSVQPDNAPARAAQHGAGKGSRPVGYRGIETVAGISCFIVNIHAAHTGISAYPYFDRFGNNRASVIKTFVITNFAGNQGVIRAYYHKVCTGKVKGSGFNGRRARPVPIAKVGFVLLLQHEDCLPGTSVNSRNITRPVFCHDKEGVRAVTDVWGINVLHCAEV